MTAKVTIKEKQFVNEYTSGYGVKAVAVVENGDRRDGIDALVEKYGEEMLYNNQGGVWSQFYWDVEVK